MLEMITYEMPEYDEMHAALFAHDLDRYFDLSDAFDERVCAVSRELHALASDRGCVMLDVYGLAFNDNPYTRQEMRLYLHRSARYPGCLQLTTWDCFGPVCDVRIADACDLANELRQRAHGTMWCMYDAA
jgi:hypothetical protein